MSVRTTAQKLFPKHIWTIWTPAALLIAAALCASLGLGTHNAFGGTGPSPQTSSETVTATVGVAATIGDSCGAGPATTALTAGGGTQESAACTFTFGTNNGTSSQLSVISNATGNFSQGTGAAAGSSFADAGSCVAPASLGTDQMGMLVTASGGTPVASVAWCGGTLNQVTGIPQSSGTAANICTTAAVGTGGTCTIEYAWNPSVAITSGSYTGQSNFAVSAS